LYFLKTSWKYILLRTFEQITAFSAIFKSKSGKLPVFGAILVIFGQLGVYLPPLTSSTTTPCPALPLPIVGTPSSF
jgi:hypothetical protein